ncbi:MAG: ABC transporter substrate-binding protein [Elusimicrobiota bacterium]
MKRLPIVLTLLLSVCGPAAADDAKEIRALMERSVNSVLDALRDKGLEREAKKKKVMEVVDPLFDFRLMAKLVLGRAHWPKFDKGQQEEFTSLFVKQLRDSYFEKVELLTDEKVEFSAPEALKDGKYQMLTHILSKGERYKLLYKLYEREKAWKVYDVEIDGISLVRSYGGQYDQFLQTGTPAELLKKMREKPLETPKDLQEGGKKLKEKKEAQAAQPPKGEPDKSPEKVEPVQSPK